MPDEQKNRNVLRWLWDQLHRSQFAMPPDRLIFEGDHDLAYLYHTGFVDTDRFPLDKWLQSFRDSRQKDGSYQLSYEQWMEKAKYRYSGPVKRPFDMMTIREGEWDEDDWKQFLKEKILPETAITYEQFSQGIEAAEQKGEIQKGIIVMTKKKKQAIARLIDEHASPRRQRALAMEQVRQHEELEAPARSKTSPSSAEISGEKSKYKGEPDQQKETKGKLNDLLSGSKK